MKIAIALLGFLILAVVFVVWFRAYRTIKGDDDPLLKKGQRKAKQDNNSLEDFIASYKRGEAVANPGPPLVTTAKPSSTPPTVAAPAPVPAAVQTMAVKREAFVAGATKLVYLSCKAGLRDHHTFAHVSLSTLSTGGAIDPALARTSIDLLICNAAMSPVAAIDVIDAGSGAANVAKSDHLKALGIRYLRLSAKSLPRPNEFHALLYKM